MEKEEYGPFFDLKGQSLEIDVDGLGRNTNVVIQINEYITENLQFFIKLLYLGP